MTLKELRSVNCAGAAQVLGFETSDTVTVAVIVVGDAESVTVTGLADTIEVTMSDTVSVSVTTDADMVSNEDGRTGIGGGCIKKGVTTAAFPSSVDPVLASTVDVCISVTVVSSSTVVESVTQAICNCRARTCSNGEQADKVTREQQSRTKASRSVMKRQRTRGRIESVGCVLVIY